MVYKVRRDDLQVILACTLALFFILTGCAPGPTQGIYRAYFGAEPDERQLATIDMGAAYEAIIDDMYYVSRSEYGTVKLIAGVHKIKWATVFGVSVMVESRGYAAFGIISKVNFESGHVYKLCADRTTGHGYKVYSWIEDITTEKIVFGEKKP